MRAAISARSSKRIRAIRSAFRSAASLQAQGPRTSRRAIATALDWRPRRGRPRSHSWSTKTTTPTATSDSPATTAAPRLPLAERDPRPAERRRPDQRVGEAEAPEGDRSGEPERDVAEQPAFRRRRRTGLRLESEPGAAVGDDPGTAGEREQGEREPDERGVDPQAAPDAGADACDRPLARRPPQVRASTAADMAPSSPAPHLDVADRDVCLEVEHGSVGGRARQREDAICVDAVVAGAEEVDRADPGVGVDHDRDVGRDRDDELADPDARVDGCRACRQRDAAEIEVGSPMPCS